MVYVIGAYHNIQYKFWLKTCEYLQFETYLTKQVDKYKIGLIAEEFSEEAMKPCGVTESIAQSGGRSYSNSSRSEDRDIMSK